LIDQENCCGWVIFADEHVESSRICNRETFVRGQSHGESANYRRFSPRHGCADFPTMPAPAPHFHLLAEAHRHKRCGNWRFVLQTADGRRQFEAKDAEPEASGERLELLAIVRGLEALEQPSRVTLLTGSASVSKGLKYGLEEWRANDWQWERHGEMVPIKNSDLWRRIDHALHFHDVDCRVWRVDEAHGKAESRKQKAEAESPTVKFSAAAVGRSKRQKQNGKSARQAFTDLQSREDAAIAAAASDGRHFESTHRKRRFWLASRRRIREAFNTLRLRLGQLGTGILPRPWLE
jgi:ribonuclease HI